MKKNIILILLALLIVGGLYYIYKQEKVRLTDRNSESQPAGTQETGDSEEAVSEEEAVENEDEDEFFESRFDTINFGEYCQSGRWLAVSEEERDDLKTFSGTLKVNYADEDSPAQLSEDTIYYFENGAAVANEENEAIDYFEDKEVEVKGIADSAGKISIYQIRCSGSESNEAENKKREEIMVYAAENINKIAGVTDDKWGVTDFEFVDNSNVYVDYGTGEFKDEDPQRVLIKITKNSKGSFDYSMLAKYKEGEDDWELTDGTDSFSEQDPNTHLFYEFDHELNKWTLI